jgi:predicted DNA-binding transcriptional regulator YafY
VTGHDHRRNQVRTFRVDRVLSARRCEVSFGDPGPFDPVEQVTRSLAGVPYTWEVEVLIETTLDAAARRIPAAVASLSEAEGGVLLRTRAERLDGMARLLAGLEWPFVVHTPDELRTALRELAATLTAAADRR